ncbi:hypothetical protein [Halorarius halobius]|uniref:hypothetical protein n=1 Tax=Halorarius halobius TaxID=2962671 RepID=UPI0020CDCF64|nr:hypothetical protein [Halorarius halobius]
MDRRGQSVQVGVIIIFGFLIIAFSAYQAAVVPDQNAQIEFNHFQQVETEFTELRTDALDAVNTGNARSVGVDLGLRYPARAFAVNPPPVSGSLRTTNAGEVELRGLSDSAADVCATTSTTVESRSLTYRPGYHVYSEPEHVTLENTLIEQEFDGGKRYSTQDFVTPGSGTPSIDLVVLTGDVGREGTDSYSLDLEPSRRYETTVDPGSSFSVVVPSTLSASTWEDEILTDDSGSTYSFVNGVSSVGSDNSRVEITFAAGEYDLSCAALGLNADPAYQPPEGSTGGGGGNASLGYGSGGTTTYSPENATQTLSLPNGRWSGISSTDEFIVNDADYIIAYSSGVERFKASFRLDNGTGELAMRIRLSRSISRDSGWNTKSVAIKNGNNNQGATLTDEAARRMFNDTAYEGADILDITNYPGQSPTSTFAGYLEDVATMDDSDVKIVTSDIEGRANVTVRREVLFSAVQPQPSDGEQYEFVRVNFETPTNTDGWELVDSDGSTTSLPSTTLSGEVYFAADESAFETERGLNDDKVYPLSTDLEDASDVLVLYDDQDQYRDEVAYEENNDSTTPTTTNGWHVNEVGQGTVANRTRADGRYLDNDSAADWGTKSQTSFFTTPGVPSVAFSPSSNGNKIQTVNNQGTVSTFGIDSGQPSVLGPKADIDGDGQDEVPYVDNNNNLKYMNSDGTVVDLDTTLSGGAKKASIGVGDPDPDDALTVYYVGSNSNDPYSVKPGGTAQPLTAADDSLIGAVGYADFDGDSASEPIFIASQTELGYVDGGTVTTVSMQGSTKVSKKSVGEPFQYNGGTRVPILNTNKNNQIELVKPNGKTSTILKQGATPKPKKAPIAPRDWDDDGTPELLFIDGNDNQKIKLVEPGTGTVRLVYDQKVKAKGVR